MEAISLCGELVRHSAYCVLRIRLHTCIAVLCTVCRTRVIPRNTRLAAAATALHVCFCQMTSAFPVCGRGLGQQRVLASWGTNGSSPAERTLFRVIVGAQLHQGHPLRCASPDAGPTGLQPLVITPLMALLHVVWALAPIMRAPPPACATMSDKHSCSCERRRVRRRESVRESREPLIRRVCVCVWRRSSPPPNTRLSVLPRVIRNLVHSGFFRHGTAGTHACTHACTHARTHSSHSHMCCTLSPINNTAL
jgi:hypothetical protein